MGTDAKQCLRNGLDLKCKAWGTYTVEPLYNGYHWEPIFSEMSLTQGLPSLVPRPRPNLGTRLGASGIFPVGMVLRNH